MANYVKNKKNIKGFKMKETLNLMLYKGQKRIGLIFGFFLIYLSITNYFVSYFIYKVHFLSLETLV